MQKDRKEYLIETLKGSNALRKEYSDFQINASLQLSLSYIQFFQSLGAISLAIIGIGISIDAILINLWTVIALILALILVVYASSFSREIMDDQLNGLIEGAKEINIKTREIDSRVVRAFEEDNINLFLDYAKSNIKEDSSSSSKKELIDFKGEIALLVLFNLLGFGVLGVVNPGFAELYAVGILIISYVLAFKNRTTIFINCLSSDPFKSYKGK